MRRVWLNVGVSIAALGLGVVAYRQGQALLGLCFAGLGVLRALATFAGKKAPKPEPSIKLNLEDSNLEE